MNAVEILLQAIQEGALLGANTFEYADADEILSGRDDSEFEYKWLRLFKDIQDDNFSDKEISKFEQLREVAFKTAFKRSSNPELSGCVSDDLELIAKGITSNQNSHFLIALLESYVGSKIPSCNIVESSVPISSLIARLRSC